MGVRTFGVMSRTNLRALRGLFAACAVALAAALFMPVTAGALPPPYSNFDYNEPFVQQTGPEVMVYDWSVHEVPGQRHPRRAARAFKDDTGKVQLMTTHFVNYRWIANTTLDSPYTHPCTKTMNSNNNSDPSTYNAKEWLASPWTPDGKTIYALVHNEYQGRRYQSGCPYQYACWYNSITSAVSTNSGATFTNTRPGHLVASIPYQFTKNGPNGYFTPSNIVRSGDGWFYAMFRAEPQERSSSSARASCAPAT